MKAAFIVGAFAYLAANYPRFAFVSSLLSLLILLR